MSASRALMQIRALNTSVATGLVTGMRPEDDPHGLGDLGQRLPLAAADDTHARLSDQRLRHLQAREPVLLRLAVRAADACLGHGRRGKLLGMSRDLCGKRRDKAIYFALMPAGDALLGRDRPCDKRICKRIRLTGDEGLPTVPAGKTRAFSAAMRDSQRSIMAPVAGSLPHDSRSAPAARRAGGSRAAARR